MLKQLREKISLINTWNFFSYFVVACAFIGVGISYSKFYLFHGVLIIFIFLTALRYLKDGQFKKKIKWHKELSFFIFFFFWYLLSIFWSFSWKTTMIYSSYILMGGAIVFIMLNFMKELSRKKRLFSILSILYIFHLLVCLLEIFTSFRWPISPFSELTFLFNREMIAGNINRWATVPTGFYWGHNHAALLTLMGLPFVLMHKNSLIKIMGTFVVCVVIYFAKSRALLALTFIGITSSFILQIFIFQKIKIKNILMFLVISLLMIAFAYQKKDKVVESSKAVRTYIATFFPMIQNRFAGKQGDILNGYGLALGERFFFLDGALKHFQRSKIIGLGAGSLIHLKHSFRGFRNTPLASIHNYWIEVMVEGGLLFFIVYIFWYIVQIKKSFVLSFNKLDPFTAYLAKSLFVLSFLFFIGVVALSSSIYFLPKWIFYGFWVSLLPSKIAQVNNERGNLKLKILDRYIGIPVVYLLGKFKKKSPIPKQYKRVGIFVSTAIGDTIISSAICKSLKMENGDLHLSFICGSNFETAKLIPYVDEVIKVDLKNPITSIYRLRKFQFDIWIDTGQWPRINAVLSFFIKAHFKIGFKTIGQYRHYIYDVPVLHSSTLHELENFYNLLLPLKVSKRSLPEIQAGKFSVSNKKIVVIHPMPAGTRSYIREWNSNNWVNLINLLCLNNFEVYLTGSKEDSGFLDGLKTKCEKPEKIFNVAGRYSISQVAGLLSKCHFAISINTGIMHLAAASGCNLLALHGPTDPKRWGPLSEKAIVIRAHNRECSPCLNLGFESRCNQNKCMNDISLGMVIKEVKKIYPDLINKHSYQ